MDHLLRNREQVIADLQDSGKVEKTTWICFWVFYALTTLYGLIMGSQNLFHGYNDGIWYTLAAAVKLPLLFLLTLAICLPLLYVLNVLIGPRAPFKVIVGILMASLTVTSILLAACALILGFFMLSTKNYAFIKLLNVAIFTVAGLYGVWFLSRALCMLPNPHIEARKAEIPSVDDPRFRPFVPADTPKAESDQAISTSTTATTLRTLEQANSRFSVPEGPQSNVGTIITWWLITYGMVGTQMAWLMRPFLGSPGLQFTFFRPQESNFYVNLMHTLGRLLGA